MSNAQKRYMASMDRSDAILTVMRAMVEAGDCGPTAWSAVMELFAAERAVAEAAQADRLCELAAEYGGGALS